MYASAIRILLVLGVFLTGCGAAEAEFAPPVSNLLPTAAPLPSPRPTVTSLPTPSVTTGRVEGRFYRTDESQPMPGVRMALWLDNDSPDQHALEVTTDAQGRFGFDHVPPGVYGLGLALKYRSIDDVPCPSFTISGLGPSLTVSGATGDGGWALIAVSMDQFSLVAGGASAQGSDVPLRLIPLDGSSSGAASLYLGVGLWHGPFTGYAHRKERFTCPLLRSIRSCCCHCRL